MPTTIQSTATLGLALAQSKKNFIKPFQGEKVICEKFLKADYLKAFINSVIRDFETNSKKNKNIDNDVDVEDRRER